MGLPGYDKGVSFSWWCVFCSVGRVHIPLHIVPPMWSSRATNSVELQGQECYPFQDALQWVSYEIVPSVPIAVLNLVVLLIFLLWHILQVACKPLGCHTRVPFLRYASVVLLSLLLSTCRPVLWWLQQTVRGGGVLYWCYLTSLDLFQVVLKACLGRCGFSQVCV